MDATSDKNFAIIHVEKLRNLGKIDAAEKHNFRLISVINADERKALSNVNFRESPEKLAKKVTARLAKLGIKPRGDSIQAYEMLMTFSPEMREKIDEKTWALANLKWAEDRYGADNILHATMHYDEKTPHLHLIITPVIEYSGQRNFTNQNRLSFKEIFGGKLLSDTKKKLSKLQSDYAEAMAEFGLRRGVKESKRVRKTIKELYKETTILREEAEKDIVDFMAEFSKFQKNLTSDSSKLSEKERQQLAEDQTQQLSFLREKAEDSFAKLIAKAETAWRSDDLERERIIFEKNLDDIKSHYQDMLKQAQKTIFILEQVSEKKDDIIGDLRSQARAIPLKTAIFKLSGIQARETQNPGESRFVFSTGLRLIVADDGRFKNETPGIAGSGKGGSKSGGRGAIDALLFLKDWSPIEAIEWLTETFSLKEIGQTIGEMEPTERKDINRETAKNEIKTLIGKSTNAWQALRENLVNQGLDAPTIDALHKSKWLSATAGGLVRVTRATENPDPLPCEHRFQFSGLLIQDSEQTDPSIAFRFETGDNGHTVVTPPTPSRYLIVTDDIIEALAIATRERALPKAKRSNIITIGRQKSIKTTEFLRSLPEKFSTIILAISNTPTALAFAAWIQSILPNATIQIPPAELTSHLEALGLPIEPEKEKVP